MNKEKKETAEANHKALKYTLQRAFAKKKEKKEKNNEYTIRENKELDDLFETSDKTRRREEPTRWRSVSFRTGRAFTKRRDVSYRVTERNFD